MDPLSLIPAGGVGTTLVVVIVYLMRQNYADRRQYQIHIDETEKRNASAIESVKASNAKENASNAKVIADLTAKVDVLTALYEESRLAKWAAEDEAAKYRRLYELGIAQGGVS